MKSSKYLIAEKPTIWTDSLADYYSKKAADLERNLQDSINQRNQKVKIAQDESFKNTLGALARFSSTAADLTKTIKAKSQQELEKEKDRLRNLPFYIENQDALNAKLKLEHDNKKKDLLDENNESEEGKKYRALIAKLQSNPETKPVAVELINASGRTLIAMQEMMARDAIAGISRSTFMNDVEWVEANPTLVAKWDASDKNPDARDAVFKQYQLDKIDHLNLNDETKAAVLGKELSRQSRTAKHINTANAVTAVTDAEDRKVLTQLKTAQTTGSFEEAVWSVRDQLINSEDTRFTADDFKSRNQKVDEYLYQTLSDLATDGYITESDLQPYLDSEFRHPAGKDGVGTPGELLFSKEQVNGLVRAAKFGTGRHLAVKLSVADNELDNLKLKAIRGEDVSKELQAIEVVFGNELKDKIKDVRETSVKDNTPDAYTREKQEWRGRLNSGNLLEHEERAKTIKNDAFKKEVEARIAHHKERRTELGYPEDDEQFVRDRIAKAFNLTLKEDEKLTGKLYELQVHLEQKLRKSFQNKIEGPNGEPIIDPNSFTLANDDFETYIVNNGINGGRVDKAPVGIFTADDQGRLNNFKVFQEQRLDAIREHKSSAKLATSQRLMDIYDRQVWNAYDGVKRQPDNGQPLKERVLDTSESVLSRNDILGFFSTKKLAPEIIYKARRLGIPPSTLIRRQLEALVKADPDYAKLHQLDAIKFPEGGDEQIYGMLERSDPNLRFAFTRADLSPNQNQRLIESWNRALDKKEYDQHLQ